MTDFADTYVVRVSPADDQPHDVCVLPPFVVLDVTKPLHVTGFLAITLNTDTTEVTFEVVNNDTNAPIGEPIVYGVDTTKLSQGPETFAIDTHATPGNVGTLSLGLRVTCTSATGASTVTAAALHCRFD